MKEALTEIGVCLFIAGIFAVVGCAWWLIVKAIGKMNVSEGNERVAAVRVQNPYIKMPDITPEERARIQAETDQREAYELWKNGKHFADYEIALNYVHRIREIREADTQAHIDAVKK